MDLELYLTLEEINMILSALGEGKYKDVALLIQKIEGQVKA